MTIDFDITVAAPQLALARPCATPAADLRTSQVRSDVRSGTAQAPVMGATRIRVTAPTTGKDGVAAAHRAFGAGYVPGSLTWSPPI